MGKISSYTEGGALRPDDALIVVRGSGNVRAFSTLYDLGFYYPGVPGDDQILGRIVLPRAAYVPSGATDSRCDAGAAATGATTIDLQKNGTSFGSIAVSASGTTGSFTVSAATDFAAGDVLSIVGPSTADATLADISIALAMVLGTS
jgi:hypothetical protein